jgi:hypothetical protein
MPGSVPTHATTGPSRQIAVAVDPLAAVYAEPLWSTTRLTGSPCLSARLVGAEAGLEQPANARFRPEQM